MATPKKSTKKAATANKKKANAKVDSSSKVSEAPRVLASDSNKPRRDVGLLIAIVFASSVVSGSLVYFGMQLSGGGFGGDALAAKIEQGIDDYVANKTAEAQDEQNRMAAEQAERTKEMAKRVPAVSFNNDHVYGNANAKISLVEYSDFSCPFCQRFHATAKDVVAQNSENVNWVYRHFPLSSHEPAASLQAMGSECVAELAGNDAFWDYADTMFAQAITDRDGLTAAAVELGAPEGAFSNCLQSQKYMTKVQNDLASGTTSGVNGTPGTIVLNNETGEAILVEGAQPAAVFQQVIDEMLS